MQQRKFIYHNKAFLAAWYRYLFYIPFLMYAVVISTVQAKPMLACPSKIKEETRTQ